MKTLSSLSFALAALIASSVSMFAASVTWNNSPSVGAWETGSNWSGGAVPGTADYVSISGGGAVTISTAVTGVTRLYVGGTTSSKLTVASGGSISISESTHTRIGAGASSLLGEIVVDGGAITSVGRFYIGNITDSVTTLTIKNGGTVTAGNIGWGTGNNQKSTLNIGGESTAAAAGWANTSEVGKGAKGTGSTFAINFNHTSTRYTFTQGSGGAAVKIVDDADVYAKAGVTVLTGQNSYKGTTKISDGAVLLANYGTPDANNSSTGVGAVTVHTGGVLGGTGYVGGDTVVNGILRPGDYAYEVSNHGILKFNKSLTLADTSTTWIAINGDTRGTGYDAFNVGTNLTLDGTLKISLLGGFSILENETKSFDVFDVTGTLSGDFDSYDLASSWNGIGLNWDTTNLATTGVISVTAIPEPSTWLLLVGGVAFLFLRFRTRQA